MAREPSSLNWFSFLLLLGAAAVAYGAWKFAPHYWTAWMVDHALADAGARCYKVARRNDVESAVREIEAETRRHIASSLGVEDPELEVLLHIENNKAIATARWKVVVRHPRVKRETVLRFDRRAVTDVTQVQW